MSCHRLLIARQASFSIKNRGMSLNEQLQLEYLETAISYTVRYQRESR